MLDNFINFVEEKHLDADSIILSVKDVRDSNQRYEHHFKPESKNNIRSISKIVSCLGVYKAIEQQLLNLESYVLPFFADVKIHNKGNVAPLAGLKIKHLLNLTMGHEIGLMFSKDVKNLPINTDYISYIVNYNIKHEPRTFFVYNNAATYLLCAIVQKLTGVYFSDWVHQTVLQYLDIEKSEWEQSHQGICLGASGLYLNNEEMHKIGLLLLNNGNYDGKRIIDSAWIDVIHAPTEPLY